MPDSPAYPTIGPQLLPILLPLLLGRRRSFREDAQLLVQRIRPAAVVLGDPPVVSGNGLVLAVNHYNRPGFGAWWIALSIAAAVQADMHWMMTAAWVYPDRLRSWTVTPLSRWVLTRVARSYGFTSTPPMPPRPRDYLARAAALRTLLRALDKSTSPVLGIAPEGFDSGDGSLQRPAAGVSHLFHHLWLRGMTFVPVGVFEEGGRLITRFGPPLDVATNTVNADPGAEQLLEQVMRGIAACLPPALHGHYS